ncbi:unnamed protein product [Kuraishia capsulata CBS 1993]|uniref:Aminopeptidase P N-terminal domain-containing protein n=1 Tax=Kuraishia capsulata CBS 1993 TaxID=1382522 RepID=W6MK66_9ASCO|nr:uncharacterized protein KUCA_T00002695001 [Kuraishia capsulata CBS 1993]CDK26721.1 unnamed protein product [Kuraishia capsulata CBS 1993]
MQTYGTTQQIVQQDNTENPRMGPTELEGKKYPAKAHAKKAKDFFLSKRPGGETSAAFFLGGADLLLYPYCDQTAPFRQNRYFYYLTGCEIPGCFVSFDLESEKLTLFLPDIDYDDVMWSGLPLSIKDAKQKYDVDEVLYVSEIEKSLKAFGSKEIFTTDTDVFKSKSFSTLVKSGDQDFFYALDEARLTKDEFEIGLLKHAALITDNCHKAVMSALPIETNETHIHAEFMYHSVRQGAKNMAYDPICCAGPHCGTLHYVKNDSSTENQHSILIDAGAEWNCYAADVTRCFPISGEWTKEHLEIYNIVSKMQDEAMEGIKPGASWEDLHLLAHKVLIKEFIKLGIFVNGTEEEIFASKASAMFFPHGLGHLLGMDTHDVAGHANYSDPDPLLVYLRLRRPLEKGMVVTNEPGCYFSPFLIEAGLKDPSKAKYIDMDVVEKYWYIGGVRIEDDILVTSTGYENLTGITKDPKEISAIVKAGISRGKDYFHNIV